jgi:ribosomal 50S subunit-associated protein YjgA (DUF615 family)
MKALASYSPAELFAASHRWTDEGLTVGEAVAEFMRLHPDADPEAVLAEIEAAAEPVLSDHRRHYSPDDLHTVGQRMTDDYSVDDAVEDFLAMHPGADSSVVRAAIKAG